VGLERGETSGASLPVTGRPDENTPVPPARPPKAVRGAHVFAVITAFCEATLYGVLAPLLPSLAQQIHLSDAAAGRVSAAYPAGMVLATVPAGAAAGRRPRGTAICGMWMVTLSCVGFALGRTELLLICARMLQGAGAAAAWAGALAWILRDAPLRRRGRMIATTLGAGFTGTVIAPIAAALAGAGHRAEVFLAFAAVLGAVALWGGPSTAPDGVPRSGTPSTAGRAGSGGARVRLRDRHKVDGYLLMLLLGTVSGICQSLAALMLASHGVRGGALAAVFLCAYAPQAVLARRLGQLIDQRGARLPMIWCMTLLGLGLPFVPLVGQPLPAALLVGTLASIAAAGLPIATALVSENAHRAGSAQGMAMAMVNGAWGVGAAGGAAGSTAIAAALAPPAAFLPAAVTCGVAAAGLARAPRRNSR